MDPINVTRTNYNLQAMGNTETIQSSGQVVIDARIGNPSNKTITVSSNTTSLIYLGSTSTLTNIKFIFNSRNAFYLYLVDYKVESTGENRVLDMAKIDYSNIYIEGTNIIKGKAYENNVPTYLMEADKIEFFGNGKLNITGYNGANGISRGTATSGNDGSDGTNGENGFGALDCNRINNDTVIINLQGGKGGAGGKGGNGQSASSSNNLIDGTLGGNGGDGGDAGKGCSISTSGIFGVTDNDGFAGLGGNGGNGGDGKDGIDARVWASINHVSYVINKSEATKGGNGGNGGLAGLNGSGDVDPNTSYNQYPKGGIGGKGGDGGDGFGGEVETGEISNPQSIYFSLEANDGGDGGDGGNGYNGGDGGAGGKGGTGSTGDGGTIFVSGKQGGTGGDGGDGGDGGNSTISGDDLSSGGGAGGAGSGGDGGDSLLGKDGAKGQNGEPGEPGAPGEYTPPPEPSCVALGTLITLANGTQVAVEDLIGNEQLLVWNMLTGEFDSAPILFIDSEPRARYDIVRLKFADGTKVDVIDEHGFYNMTLNKYVFLDENAEQYIGHYFNKQSIDENGKMVWESVQLKKVKHISKKTSAWSPVTYSHLCYYVNGMLSMPGGTTSLINIFDVEADTMTIDMDSYNADIAEYGLFTYEEFAEIMPVSEYVFDAFNAQYFKVAMGKGILTWDDLATLFETYQDFLI